MGTGRRRPCEGRDPSYAPVSLGRSANSGQPHPRSWEPGLEPGLKQILLQAQKELASFLHSLLPSPPLPFLPLPFPPLSSPLLILPLPLISPPLQCWTPGLQTVNDQFLLLISPAGCNSLGSYHRTPRGLLQWLSLANAPFIADFFPPCLIFPTSSFVLLGLHPQCAACPKPLPQGLHLGEPKPGQLLSKVPLGRGHTGRESTLISQELDGPASGCCNCQGSPEKHNL